jgi:Leucine-rich repeat (LRR) protein
MALGCLPAGRGSSRSVVESICDNGRIIVNLMSMPLLLSALLFSSGPATRSGTVNVDRSVSTQSGELCREGSTTAVATFEDQKLEAAVRTALSAAENVALTCDLVSGLTSLVAREAGIANLEGIQNLTSLERLDLTDNAVTDISQLAGLTSLNWLDLWGNAIVDVSALAGLRELTYLSVGSNEISNVDALAALTTLTLLRIRENEIGDISALGDLTQLINLDVSYNNISDMSALGGMTRLETLRVYNNPITDISAMRGMTSLSEVHVHGLAFIVCSEVRALRDRGVGVAGCELERIRHWWWAILLGMGLVAVGARLLKRRNDTRWATWRAEARQTGDVDGSI